MCRAAIDTFTRNDSELTLAIRLQPIREDIRYE